MRFDTINVLWMITNIKIIDLLILKIDAANIHSCGILKLRFNALSERVLNGFYLISWLRIVSSL